MTVKLGTSQSSAGMTTQLWDNNTFFVTTWTSSGDIDFTVASAGTYYLGFHAYSDANQSHIAVDDILVTDTGLFDGDLSFYNLTVNSTDSTIFGGKVVVGNNLSIGANGVMNLGGNDVTVESTLTNNGTLKQTKTASSGSTTEFLRIKNAAGSTTKYDGVDITPTSADMGSTTAEIKGNQTGGCTNNASDALLLRCFKITPTNQESATIKFWYKNAELNGQTYNSLKLWHYSTSWTQVGSNYSYSTSCGSGEDCWFQAENISTYSPFGVGSGSPPTAIELYSFTATPHPGGTATLTWETATEFDTAGFNLYRAMAEAGPYTQINAEFIPARGDGVFGASYSFVDTPGYGAFYYKLEGVDYAGTKMLHGPVSVHVRSVHTLYLPLLWQSSRGLSGTGIHKFSNPPARSIQ